MNDIETLYADISACLLALANALDAKGVLTKAEFAAAAQERFLALKGLLPWASTATLPMLHELATRVETRSGD